MSNTDVRLWVLNQTLGKQCQPIWQIVGNDMSSTEAERVKKKHRNSIIVPEKAAKIMQEKCVWEATFRKTHVCVGPYIFEV